MNKYYKYTIPSGGTKEVTFDVGVKKIGLSNASGSDGASSIEKLKDIELTDLQNDQILVYDSTSETWKNKDQLTAGDGISVANGVISLNEEANLVFNSLNYSNTPKKTGGKWVNGNDLYKLTINIQSPMYLPNVGTLELTIPVSGVEQVVNYETFFTDGTDFLAIVNNNNISVKCTETKVIITTTADYSAYTGYVTIYYTLKKAFDKVLYTTDYSDTSDSSQYQLWGNNGYNNRIWLPNAQDEVYIGLTNYPNIGINAYVLSKTETTVKNRYRRLGGGSQQGLSDLAINTAYGDKGYYKQIPPSGGNIAFGGNRMGIKVIFNNLNELLAAFFD